VEMHVVVRRLLYVSLAAFTLYLGTYIMQYGMLMLMCVMLLILGSLLYVHVEAASSRQHLLTMTRLQRERFHANNLPLFSVIPTNNTTNNNNNNNSGFHFREWEEWRWRKFADMTGDDLTNDIMAKRNFHSQVGNYDVVSGLPTPEEVEKNHNTIVLTVRGLWAGLAARINPVLNSFLNRFVKCWNRSLVYTCIRLSCYGLPYPVVSIDFPTADVATLNFGQKDDCMMMSYVYNLIHAKYPTAKIILMSVCLGGLRILNWLGRNPNPPNLSAVVLESPLPSVKHLLRGFMGKYYSDELYHTFCLVVPNFRPELEDQYSFLRPMKPGKSHEKERCRIPILMGFIETDPFSNKTHLSLFIERFPNLTIFATQECDHKGKHIDHGKLYRLPAYQQAVQTFLTHLHHTPLPSHKQIQF
jgi:hypothetical protein